MSDWLKALAFFLRYGGNILQVLWRYNTGRWYVFRDQPHFLVVVLALLLYKSADDDIKSLARQARAELRLRRRQA